MVRQTVLAAVDPSWVVNDSLLPLPDVPPFLCSASLTTWLLFYQVCKICLILKTRRAELGKEKGGISGKGWNADSNRLLQPIVHLSLPWESSEQEQRWAIRRQTRNLQWRMDRTLEGTHIPFSFLFCRLNQIDSWLEALECRHSSKSTVSQIFEAVMGPEGSREDRIP